MQLRGIIRTAVLQERPEASGQIELSLLVQGVGPGQPRRLIIPHALLVADESLDPDVMGGCSFAAEVELDPQGRGVVGQIVLAARVLRPDD